MLLRSSGGPDYFRATQRSGYAEARSRDRVVVQHGNGTRPVQMEPVTERSSSFAGRGEKVEGWDRCKVLRGEVTGCGDESCARRRQ